MSANSNHCDEEMIVGSNTRFCILKKGHLGKCMFSDVKAKYDD